MCITIKEKNGSINKYMSHKIKFWYLIYVANEKKYWAYTWKIWEKKKSLKRGYTC